MNNHIPLGSHNEKRIARLPLVSVTNISDLELVGSFCVSNIQNLSYNKGIRELDLSFSLTLFLFLSLTLRISAAWELLFRSKSDKVYNLAFENVKKMRGVLFASLAAVIVVFLSEATRDGVKVTSTPLP